LEQIIPESAEKRPVISRFPPIEEMPMANVISAAVCYFKFCANQSNLMAGSVMVSICGMEQAFPIFGKSRKFRWSMEMEQVIVSNFLLKKDLQMLNIIRESLRNVENKKCPFKFSAENGQDNAA
jgi:hypothetical protein